MSPPAVKVAGVGSIPSGYLLGRTDAGIGDVQLLDIGEVLAGVAGGAPAGGGGGGTVTSVALTVPAELSVAGSPVTGSGTLAVTWATQTANKVFASAVSGGAAVPAFRALVAADLPATAVTPGSYTYSSITVDAQGRLTAASSGAAPVASANPTATVSGSAVNGVATTYMRSDAAPALANTAVTPGSYTFSSFTVDQQGRLTAASSASLGANVATFLATPSSANLAAAVTDETGTGLLVFATNPVLTTPNIGTPSAGVLTNATGLPISTGLTGAGTGVLTALAVNVGSAGAFVVNGGALGTPSSGTLTNATGLPIAGITGLGAGVATWLATPSSANLAAAVTGETGSGALVFATSPALTTPDLGTPSAAVLTNATGLPLGSVTGLGANVATFLGTPSSANFLAAVTGETGTSGGVVFAGSPTLITPVLGDATGTSLQLNSAGAGQLLTVGGTLTTAGGQLINFSATLASSFMTAQYNLLSQPVFIPSGASPLVNAYGIFFTPSMGSSAINTTSMHGILARLDTLAGYSGVITNGNAFNALTPFLSGTNPITSYTSFLASTIVNGQGITTGTVLNYGFRLQGVTASAASGGTIFNYGMHMTIPAGSGAGTNYNFGLLITGNGGASATLNYALYSDSTAPCQIGGMFQFLGATASFPALKRSTTTLQVRLADDSADAPLSASQLTSTIAIGTAPLVVTSTTNVANLNASSLGGATFASPGAIGETASSTVKATYVKPSVGNALTAVGTNRATALQLAAQMNNVTTAAAGTGVLLPVGVIGMEVDVFAAAGIAAATIQVYATASETIDTVAGSTGVVLTKAKRCNYKFVAANTWVSAQWGAISA